MYCRHKSTKILRSVSVREKTIDASEINQSIVYFHHLKRRTLDLTNLHSVREKGNQVDEVHAHVRVYTLSQRPMEKHLYSDQE